jgi:hypothetical protein
MNSTT